MIRFCFFQFFILLPLLSTGQNLVLNGNCEDYYSCPTGPDNLYLAKWWNTPTSASPDYFHVCSSAPLQDIPYNLYMGYQHAHSGTGYIGAIVYSPSDGEYREYLMVELSVPLLAGQCYEFSMYVNLNNPAGRSIDNIGVYFSVSTINVSTYNALPYTPHLINPGTYYSDTLNWELFTGIYTASGGEKYLTIGNFNNNASTNVFNFGVSGISYLYYYFDDISLYPCTAIPEESPEKASLYPNPFNHELSIDQVEGCFTLTIYDLFSRERFIIYQCSKAKIKLDFLEPGIYTYCISQRENKCTKGKLIKEK